MRRQHSRVRAAAAVALLGTACATADPSGTYELRGVGRGGLPAKVWTQGDSAAGDGQYERIHRARLLLRPDGVYELVQCVEAVFGTSDDPTPRAHDASGGSEGPYRYARGKMRLGFEITDGGGTSWLEGRLRGGRLALEQLAPPATLHFVRTAPWRPPPPAVPDTGMPPYEPPPEDCPPLGDPAG